MKYKSGAERAAKEFKGFWRRAVKMDEVQRMEAYDSILLRLVDETSINQKVLIAISFHQYDQLLAQSDAQVQEAIAVDEYLGKIQKTMKKYDLDNAEQALDIINRHESAAPSLKVVKKQSRRRNAQQTPPLLPTL